MTIVESRFQMSTQCTLELVYPFFEYPSSYTVLITKFWGVFAHCISDYYRTILNRVHTMYHAMDRFLYYVLHSM